MKKRNMKIMCLLMSVCMISGNAPGLVSTVSAAEPETVQNAADAKSEKEQAKNEENKENGAYDDIVNSSHAAWTDYKWNTANGEGKASTSEIVKEGSNWLDFKATASAGNAMANRALIYSTQAGDRIKNGWLEATFTPTTEPSGTRFGLLFRCTAQGDCMYFAYDNSNGWYLQRKYNNTSVKLTASGKKIMAKPGEEMKARVEFKDNTINAWVTYQGETTQIFTNETATAGAQNAPIQAGKTGFMIGRTGGTPGVYLKDIDLEDTIDSSTTNGTYDWEKDTFEPFDKNAECAVVERDAKNYYDLEVKEDLALENAVILQKAKGTAEVNKIKTGKIDAYITDLGKADGKSSDFAAVYRYADINNFAMVGFNEEQGWYWLTRVDGKDCYKKAGTKVNAPEIGKAAHFTVDYDGTDVEVTVDGKVISDGWYTAEGEGSAADKTLEANLAKLPGGYNGFLLKGGHVHVHDYQTVSYDVDAGEDEIGTDPVSISQGRMEVSVNKNFPQIIKYTFTDKEKPETLYGQPRGINTLKINDKEITVDKKNVTCKAEGNKAVYTMNVKSPDVEAVITAEIVAQENNIVEFNITEIETVKGTVGTIELPGMLMASVTNQDADAQLAYSVMSGNTKKKGDTYIDIDKTFNQNSDKWKDYQGIYAFVSNANFSAGLWSNSENNNDLKVTASKGVAQGEDKQSFTYMGLGSSVWTVEREGVKSDLPSMKVAITRDANGNGKVDWQDGAIAYRKIMESPLGSESVKDMITIRIVENIAGQAAHPFLESADGIKRTSLATDGLGQQVLLKGYANEGHDSGHPDYGDIGRRIGGEEDMNELLDIAHRYGTEVGIHINASEGYPEAKSFNETLMKKGSFGWNWMDESYSMDTMYDLTSGSRAKRLQELADKVGDKLDYIYLDVWSNDTWSTNKVSQQFNDHGWRCANEWGYINEKDATWNHWAVDVDYGDNTKKGFNSDIARFIRNDQKDSWQANYPKYGGTMLYPLLGGENSVSFEGWQRAKDFDDFLAVTFNDNLPTKYLQHFKVMEWENDGTKSLENGNTEKRIVLRDGENGEGKNEVVVERVGNAGRKISLNGTVILEGEANLNSTGVTDLSNENYLIPWNWAADGTELAKADQKLYHWARKGEQNKEWTLPAEWQDCKNLKMYRLTDTGKTEETVIPVTNGKVTLSAEKETAYVLYRGESKEASETTREDMEELNWGEGTGLKDPNFTTQTLDAWEVKGNEDKSAAVVKKEDNHNPVLQVKDNEKEVSLTQKITGLESGKSYMAYVGVDNRSDRKAYIEVKTTDGKTASNYAERSAVKNYVGVNAHNTEGAVSYMQNMPVVFTVPKDAKTAELTLRVEAGKGTVQYDEIRVCEYKGNNFVDENTFKQDFENNVYGLYPFVVGDHQGRPTDVKVHLSERNGEYTQIGWNDRLVDDVINGNWSVKAHQLCSLGGIVYQTIPQTYRFKAGEKYTVSFKYEQGTDDAYAFVYGKGEHVKGDNSSIITMEPLKASTEGTYTFEFTPDSDDCWIGIYSNENVSITESSAGAKPWKMGKADFILDDLTIVKAGGSETPEVNKSALQAAYDEMKKTDLNLYEDGKEKDAFKTALEAAKAVLADKDAKQEAVDKAEKALKDAKEKLVPKQEETEEVTQKDKDTNTEVSFEKGSVPEGTEFKAQDVTESAPEEINDVLKDYKVYDLSLMLDGKEVTPENPVTVTLPVPENVENPVVYRITEGNAKTRAAQSVMELVEGVDVRNGKVIFTTDTLGTYAVGEKVEEQPTPPAELDKSALNDEIREAEAIDLTKYEDGHVKNAFTTALNDAKKAAEKAETQDEIDAAKQALVNAAKELETVKKEETPEVNKSDLQAVYNEMKKVDLSQYKNGKEKNTFRMALEKARKVLADKEATQEEVDNAKAALTDAKEKLETVKKDEKPTGLLERAVALVRTAVRVVAKILKAFF